MKIVCHFSISFIIPSDHRRPGLLGADGPVEGVFVGRIVRVQHVDLAVRLDYPKDDRVLVDADVGPGEVDLVAALLQVDGAFLLDQGEPPVLDVYPHGLPLGQSGQLDARLGRDGHRQK